MNAGPSNRQDHSVVWRLGDCAGLEHANLLLGDGTVTVAGNIITRVDSEPITIQYQFDVDEAWYVRSFRATAMLGAQPHWRLVQLSTKGNGHWFMMSPTGERTPAFVLTGCIDVLPAFSPVGYLLPVRRLELAVGESAEADQAWISFPDFTYTRTRRRYTRLEARRYRCEAIDGHESHDFTVDAMGLVTEFGDGLWRQLGPDDPEAL